MNNFLGTLMYHDRDYLLNNKNQTDVHRHSKSNYYIVKDIKKNGGLVNGVDFNIVYSTPNSGTTYYTYKIDSVKESHEILINISAGENSTNLRIKIGSNWKNVLKAYQKVDGKWIEINVDSLNKTAKYVRIT